MADIQLRTYQDILGRMIGKMIANTDLTDLSAGSRMLTILEVAASSDLSIEAKLLEILKIRNIDKCNGVDLENLGAEMGVTPSRYGSSSSSATLTISESAFTKVSTVIYAGAIAPASGDTSIKVANATRFNANGGTIFIGRGTSTYEALAYTRATNTGSYWLIQLASPLTKDHLVGEEVVMAQGGDRQIPAGTTILVPTSSGGLQITFHTLIKYVLLDGEDTLTGVAAVSDQPGLVSVVGRNKIKQFQNQPWSTAAVTNPESSVGGRDSETDAELRQRIKDYVHTLGKGTKTAIERSVIGVSDQDQGNRVVSAFLREPTNSSQHGILFIDDGGGLAPTFDGIGVETIITSAVGTESFIQLQQWPLVKCQTASIATEPFNLSGGEFLFVEVDGISEQWPFPVASFRNPGVASAQEVAEAINKIFTTVEARAKAGQLFLTPVADDPDYIRVGASTLGSNANAALRFPTRRQFTIRLYDNDVLLQKNGSNASIQSLPNSQWPVMSAPQDLQLSIDGITSQLVQFTDLDFANFSSSPTLSGGTVSDWVKVINNKFIGITAAARDDGTFTLTSNRGRASNAAVSVIASTSSTSLSTKIFPAGASATGTAPQYTLNRLLGQIQLAQRMTAGHSLKAGTSNTRGFAVTLGQPTYSLLANPQMVIVPDSTAILLSVPQMGTLTFVQGSGGVQRIQTSVTGLFNNLKTDDWVHLYGAARNGLFRVKSVTTTELDLFDPNSVAGTNTLDGVNVVLAAFRTTGIPQIINLPVGSAVSGASIVSSFNSQALGAIAELQDDNSIKIYTTRYSPVGALVIASLCGSAANIGLKVGDNVSNDPHAASAESADLTGTPTGKLTISVSDPTGTDLKVNGTPFSTKDFANKGLLTYLGASAGYIREPAIRLANNELTMRQLSPTQPEGFGNDMEGTSLSWAEFGQSDNMVFLIDNDPSRKTFDIPMYVDGVVASPSVPSISQFDIADSTGALLGSSTRWLGHRFDDYRVWLQARANFTNGNIDGAFKATSVQFGPNGERISLGVFYPDQPGQTANAFFSVAHASYSLDDANDKVLINLTLASGNEDFIGLTPNKPVQVGYSGSTVTTRFLYPVDLTSVSIGHICSLQDANFNTANRRQFKVAQINNLVDYSRSYQFQSETGTGSVSGGTDVTLDNPPANPVIVGDKITATGVTKLITAVDGASLGGGHSNTITVQTGGNFKISGGTIVVNSTNVAYTAYNAATGVFSGLVLDPVVAGFTAGRPAYQAYTNPSSGIVTTVNTTTDFLVSPAIATSGSGQNFTITHQTVIVDSNPNFGVAVGDKLQVAGQILTITSVISPTSYLVDSPFGFSGVQGGIVSRIQLIGNVAVAGVNETIQSSSSQAVRVYDLPASSNQASSLISALNNTAGVRDLVSASALGTGAAPFLSSTEDSLNNGSTYITLQNGESYVYSATNASPAFTLKEPLAVAPVIGDKVRLVPATSQNITDHFSRKQISGLTVAADVALVDSGRRVQVSSKTPGGIGQVYAIGGRASGQSAFAIRGTGQVVNSSRAQIELDRSVIDVLIPGHTVKMYQPGRAKKNFVGTTPGAGDAVQISSGALTLSQPLASVYSFTCNAGIVYTVRSIGRSRMRYEILSGTGNIPAVQASDWVLVGDGSSYMGNTPQRAFSSANQGWFQVQESDGSTYFDVENQNGVNEFVTITTVTSTTQPFVFCPYHSARPGDQISVGQFAPVQTANKGTFVITGVPSANVVNFTNAAFVAEGPLVLGSAGVGSISVLDQGYTTYRKVIMVAPKPSDPTNRCYVVVAPGNDIGLLTEGQGAKISMPNRLGFGTDPVPGMSGYQFWTGLKRTAQRTVDGYEPDTVTYPGVRASGAVVEVREPQIKRVAIGMTIKTAKGVSLQAISDSIKSAITGYINALGLGKDVVLSEIIKLVKEIQGIDAAIISNPAPTNVDGTLAERITIGDNAIARIASSDVTLS